MPTNDDTAALVAALERLRASHPQGLWPLRAALDLMAIESSDRPDTAAAWEALERFVAATDAEGAA